MLQRLIGRSGPQHDAGPVAIAPGLALMLGRETTRLRSPGFSRGRADGMVAELSADHGRVGVDIETRARIALNTTADDGWLTSEERSRVAASSDPVGERLCCWVLKEAYGKALGVGLALPPQDVGFHAAGEHIVADGEGCVSGWRFLLLTAGRFVIGVAHHATPFAPAGKKPPGPLVDR